ncbi:papain-like cysteine protease family protein [Priestia megaterium]|uniref:papain-like cysteine protease family protein n=1 Tax=Priestia megaterium TaxID=1404 RepID=UPI0028778EA7|nr:papain-like cysteine protease family protein [Priestia megaterium]
MRSLTKKELFTFENYTVPGTIPAIAQTLKNGCWATVLTMLINWKNKTSLEIDAVLLGLAEKYLDIYKDNEGISGSEKKALLESAGLVGEAPQNYTPEGILRLLKLYGPLWATTVEGSGNKFSIHARIIYGISGDGLDLGTTLHIVDPSGGKLVDEAFVEFIEKFEREARTSGSPDPQRIQMIHLP